MKQYNRKYNEEAHWQNRKDNYKKHGFWAISNNTNYSFWAFLRDERDFKEYKKGLCLRG